MKEKRILIISVCLIALIFVLAIITVTVLKFQKYDELSSVKGNILYYNENEKQEENEVLIVGINNQNEIIPENTVSENNTNKDLIKQQVDIPYYIKVNYQENVVTVYKKDSSRELYCANEGNALLMWTSNTA